MGPIVQTFLDRTPRSAERAGRRAGLFPGGDFRAVALHAPYALTMAHGAGPWLHDVDGHAYLDLIGNYTSLVHGNAYPPIVEAATAAVAAGTCWPAGNDHMVALAEELTGRVASVERVRFTNSGSEATMQAAFVARAVTGRRKVLMARYGYHGSYDDFALGNRGEEGGDTLVAPYGDLAAWEAALDRHGDHVACVIVEPVLGSSGVVAATPAFLAGVAAAARAAGALVVLDEVITFRLATGGAQALAGVAPDLTTFGKLVGGGFPVGAVGGRADVLGVTDPAQGRLVLSGTFNANPVTAAAGTVSVRELTAERIAGLDAAAGRLADGLCAAAAAHGVPFSVRRAGSLLNAYLSAEAPPSIPERTDAGPAAAFHLACLNHGLFFSPRGLMATSTVLTDELVDDAIERAARAFADMAAFPATPPP